MVRTRPSSLGTELGSRASRPGRGRVHSDAQVDGRRRRASTVRQPRAAGGRFFAVTFEGSDPWGDEPLVEATRSAAVL